MPLLALVLLLLWPLPAWAAGWSLAAAGDLVTSIDAAADEGLDPARFEPSRLSAAMAAGEGPFLDATADRLFRRLAAAYAGGVVPAEARVGWRFPTRDAADLALTAERALEQVRDGASVQPTLDALLPRAPAYRALRAALAATPATDMARRTALAVNLERWRWLPPVPAGRLLWVNVPAFELDLLRDGAVEGGHRVIVGKPKTPTPQFAAEVRAVILNPEWVVPASIQKESINRLMARDPARARAQGYVRTATGVTQQPGPSNQLGVMKLAMPNPYSIYLHDTQARTLFDRPARGFSHGCVRVQRPLELAQWLLDGTSFDRGRIDAAVASGAMTEARLAASVPVWIVYLTAVADGEGELRLYPDIYGRDAAIAEALRRPPALQETGRDGARATLAAAPATDCSG